MGLKVVRDTYCFFFLSTVSFLLWSLFSSSSQFRTNAAYLRGRVRSWLRCEQAMEDTVTPTARQNLLKCFHLSRYKSVQTPFYRTRLESKKDFDLQTLWYRWRRSQEIRHHEKWWPINVKFHTQETKDFDQIRKCVSKNQMTGQNRRPAGVWDIARTKAVAWGSEVVL